MRGNWSSVRTHSICVDGRSAWFQLRRISGTGKAKAKWDKYENKSQVKVYNTAADSTLPEVPKKRKFDGEGSGATPAKKKMKVEGEEESELR